MIRRWVSKRAMTGLSKAKRSELRKRNNFGKIFLPSDYIGKSVIILTYKEFRRIKDSLRCNYLKVKR